MFAREDEGEGGDELGASFTMGGGLRDVAGGEIWWLSWVCGLGCCWDKETDIVGARLFAREDGRSG